MSQIRIIDKGKQLVISGEVRFSNVVMIRAEGEKIIRNYPGSQITIDFSEISHCDSSILSLILCWKRLGKKLNKKIALANAKPELLHIAEMCGIKQILYSL